MEALSNLGNHLVSDSTAIINATDGVSAADADDSLLSLAGGPRRRRHDDDESDGLEDDDLESMASVPVDGKKPVAKVEEERELPPHACA